jgi:cysteine-rich repeat protein
MTCKFEVSSLAMIAVLAGVPALGCTPEEPPGGFTATLTVAETGDEGPAECGDGVTQLGEECDFGPENAENAVCLPSCEIASCHDGFVYTGIEACDDGNLINTDGCVLNCELATCGDGFKQAGVEICDDGNSDEADGCTSTCTTGTCPDGVIQDGEQCDDGDVDTSDECPACQVAYCGDGYVQQGVEFCDDGNLEPNDACTYPFCEHNLCGDGVLYEGMEECDDGNDINGDECTLTCTTAFCGDGVKHTGVEECDDGNMVDDDFCTNACISLLFFAEGPQTNVDEADLGGWETCWTGTYGGFYPGLTATILGEQCTGSKLLLGCRQVGSPIFTLLAMGDRTDVLFDTAQGNVTHDANGVSWYFDESYSMGFADEGTGVQRSSCDVANASPELRLCWHTQNNSISNGYRCGSNFPFNNTWERVIMHAD